MKAYVCDICGNIIPEPHTARMREFCFSISNCDSYQVGAHIIDVPTKDKIKKKIHLCSNCFENLSNIAKHKAKGGGVMADKIKAIQPMITVGGKIEKPCYSITYYDTSDKQWHVGFSSFDFANVKKWLKEEFEVVAETADFVELVRCKDCKHWGGVTFGYICRRFSGSYTRNETRENDFCSYGEKR